MACHTLTPTWIDIDISGWELTEGQAYLACHTTFDAENFDRDVEMAMNWAESVIGLGRLDWRHTRDQHGDRWEVGR